MIHKKIAMGHDKKIGLVAHDNKKRDHDPDVKALLGWPSFGTFPLPAIAPRPIS